MITPHFYGNNGARTFQSVLQNDSYKEIHP